MIHVDGKVVKNADLALARDLANAAEIDTPAQEQKAKSGRALALVNFVTPEQRLVDQIAVPQNLNEEAAVAARWAEMDLAGVGVTTDAAHAVKANARPLTQNNGDDYRSAATPANRTRSLADREQPASSPEWHPG